MAKLASTRVYGNLIVDNALNIAGQLTSTVTTGTAPFVIASTTTVPNLNADLLDGQHGSYYQPASTAITTSNIGAQTVDKANKLTTPRLFTVTDNDGTNSQAASLSFDGSSSYTIKLPSIIKASITGIASGNLTSDSTLDASKLSGTIPAAVAQTEWDNAYSHSINTTGSVHGSTTLGENLLRLANTDTDDKFIRINYYNNTVTLLNAANFRTSIGAGTGNGTVTSVSGSSTVVSSGGSTPTISLAASYGDTQNPYASKAAKLFLATPVASADVPSFRAIDASDIPTLNQNTTGSALKLNVTDVRTLEDLDAYYELLPIQVTDRSVTSHFGYLSNTGTD